MSSRARVSIILPTHNRRSTIRRAVESVLNQRYGDFELIIVDDASTDDTVEVLGRFNDRRIRFIRLSERRGAGAARNAGIEMATAPILGFQDSDDVWRPDKLARQLAVFEGSPARVGVVYSDMVRIYSNGRRAYHESPEVPDASLVRNKKYAVYGIGIQSALIKRAAVEAVGRFDETLPAFEDLELFIRLSRLFEFRRLADPLVLYSKVGGGISSDRHSVVAARERLLRAYRGDLKTSPAFYLAELLAIKRAKLGLRSGGEAR